MQTHEMSQIMQEFLHSIGSSELYDEMPGRWHDMLSGWPDGDGAPFRSESELNEVRRQCRELALTNEFAINGYENRISYIVGSGYACKIIRRGSDSQSLCDDVQNIINEFIIRNHWYRRQQEIVRRMDRDGESFLRYFEEPGGRIAVRFVEPSKVRTPQKYTGSPEHSFGILAAPNDSELIRGYFIEDEFVPSSEIQHRRANVDCSTKRGIPLFYPVLKNLQRAEKILRNMSVVASVQSAIAIIRKHTGGNAASVRQFVQNEADVTRSDLNGRPYSYKRYAPGTILDATSGIEYEFPASSIDASSYVAILQAELRAVASRLVMPEFMLTSDASNANYSSTMVAEGPSVRNFQRLQRDMVEMDTEVFHRVIRSAVYAQVLPEDVLSRVSILCIPPNLAVRDRLSEARADEILLRCGVLSPQTMALRHGLDPENELENISKKQNSSIK
jgi:Bacteriophage capsid protein